MSAVAKVAPAPAARRAPLRSAVNFFRTPKGTVLWVLALLLTVAGWHTASQVVPEVAAAVLAAAGVDLAIAWVKEDRLGLPDGAILSGLIVAAIVAPTSPWYVAPATAAVAVASKHAVRTRWSNVFNPAALALVVSFYLFKSEQSWWGALPYLSPLWVPLLAGLGLYVAAKVNKVPLVLTFLGAALTLFTLASYAGDTALVAEIYRSPDIEMLLFFATLMLTDPPTSPAKHAHQVWFGLIVAVASCVAFLHLGALWFLAGGLLAGNVYESARRVVHRRSIESARRRQPAAGHLV